MNYALIIPFHYWMILGLCFWIIDLLKFHHITKPLTFAAVGVGIVVYANPETPLGWQLWGFFMLLSFSGIYYLKKLPPIGEEKAKPPPEAAAERLAADLVGTRVTLDKPLHPAADKLEIRGRYWKVAASRDFPAGSVVEVVGHRGGALEIVGSSLNRDDDLPTLGAVDLSDYARDRKVEHDYGKPDIEYWGLFRDALGEHRKLALVQAYHVISGLRGLDIESAAGQLNTFTLALYDTSREGEYLTIRPQMYSQPRLFGFLYMDGHWRGSDPRKFSAEMDALEAALSSEWAQRYRGEIAAEKVLRAVRMIRDQQAPRLSA